MTNLSSIVALNALKPADRELTKRIIKEHVWPYRWQVCAALGAMGVAGGATTVMAKLMEPIINDVFMQKNAQMLTYISVSIVAVFFVKGLAVYVESYFMNFVGHRLITDLQHRIFKVLVAADLNFFHHHPTGDLISRAINDVSMMRNAFTHALMGAGKYFVTLLCLTGLMFYQDWMLASIAFFAFPTALYPIIRLGKRLKKATVNTQQETSRLLTRLTQVFSGIRLVKAYVMERAEVRHLGDIAETIFKHALKSSRTRALSNPFMETLGGMAIMVVVLYGGTQVIEGTRTPGAFFSFITALLLAYEPMKKLSTLNANVQEGLAAAGRVFSVLEMRPHIKNPSHPLPFPTFQGRIDMQDIVFGYKPVHQDEPPTPIIQNLSLTIEPGQTVALVGPSGAGKSTLMNLLPRFYDVDKGSILVDGIDIRHIKLQDLRHQIALVAQEVTLFDDTVQANIAYGFEKIDKKEIIKSAKAADAHDFIMALPQGYDTFVGEQGIKLSGGQRQRIAIARALLKNAPLLLLDEATSALDNQSEQQVQSALGVLMKGRTCLVIAHRLSTIRNADVICVMDRGQIVEKGTHKSLLAEGGLYADLYALQFKEAEIHDLDRQWSH